ncbi:MAG: methyltransferase [Clostridiales bacterium]|jgi:tRNA1Val (adenine37-N6)-methyltransferase|nr:methyltransferase [Clostridiales bacterium]
MSERIDDLQYNGLKLIQDTDGFRFGCDAVELANFVSGKRGSRACDLGSGSGIISVLLAAKKGFKMTAVEIDGAAADLCVRNARINNLTQSITVEHMRIQDLPQKYPRGAFDIAVANPPYQKLSYGKPAAAAPVARHELTLTLKELVAAAAYLLKFGGKFYLVHKSQRMAEALFLCKAARLEPKVLQLLAPAVDKPPHLFLLQCAHSAAEGLVVLPERLISTQV